MRKVALSRIDPGVAARDQIVREPHVDIQPAADHHGAPAQTEVPPDLGPLHDHERGVVLAQPLAVDFRSVADERLVEEAL
jgi:hypothetical protein